MKKRISAFIFAIVMALTMAVSAFAAEKPAYVEAKAEVGSADGVTPLYDNPVVKGTLAPGGSLTLYPTLASYVGLSRYFSFSATSDGTGVIYYELYDPKGKLISDDWIVSVNRTENVSFFLPSSGTYTFKAYSWGTTEDANVYAWWEW